MPKIQNTENVCFIILKSYLVVHYRTLIVRMCWGFNYPKYMVKGNQKDNMYQGFSGDCYFVNKLKPTKEKPCDILGIVKILFQINMNLKSISFEELSRSSFWSEFG